MKCNSCHYKFRTLDDPNERLQVMWSLFVIHKNFLQFLSFSSFAIYRVTMSEHILLKWHFNNYSLVFHFLTREEEHQPPDNMQLTKIKNMWKNQTKKTKTPKWEKWLNIRLIFHYRWNITVSEVSVKSLASLNIWLVFIAGPVALWLIIS